jgi:hypothetical protein
MGCKSSKKSIPNMGEGIKDKRYKWPSNTSIPKMGKIGTGRTISTDVDDLMSGRPVGKRFEVKYTQQQQDAFKAKANKGLPPGAVRWGKGTYRMPGSDVSIPIMGAGGAAVGGFVGKKIGSFIGSAGRLIGPKHEKYGRQAGEYIGGTLGSGIGLAGMPF